MAINLGYFVRESVVNFRRNWVMSLGAVITIYLSLLLVGVSFASGFVVTQVVESEPVEVVITATGRCLALAIPMARKPRPRSS